MVMGLEVFLTAAVVVVMLLGATALITKIPVGDSDGDEGRWW